MMPLKKFETNAGCFSENAKAISHTMIHFTYDFIDLILKNRASTVGPKKATKTITYNLNFGEKC